MQVQGRPYTAEDEIDLRELALLLWRRRTLILGVTVAAAVLAAGVSLYVLPPTYESRTIIKLSTHTLSTHTPETHLTPLTPAEAVMILTSMSFLRPLAARYGITDERKLERMVRAEPVRDTRMVRLRIRDRDPERLRAFTQDVVREFLELASRSVRKRRELTRQQIAAIQAQLREVRRTLSLSREVLARVQDSPSSADTGFTRSFALNAVSVSWLVFTELTAVEQKLQADLVAMELPSLVQAPYIPPKPVSPRPALNAAIAAVLGLMLSTVGVLVRSAWTAPAEVGRVPAAMSVESNP